MKTINNTIALSFLLLLTVSCNRNVELEVPNQTDSYRVDTTTPLGKKLQEMYDQYDVEIHYKWDRSVFSSNAVADPADINDVLPYVELMEEIFFKAIRKIQDEGSNFEQKESPINYFLIGSGINYGGSNPTPFGESTVGQAGNIQPNRLTLGGITEYAQILRTRDAEDPNLTDNAFINACINESAFGFPGEGGLAGFLYHEFTHYIDAKYSIPKGFELPAFENYIRGTSAYMSVSDAQARERGFMLPYGMQNEHEDFATYVQIMITYPRDVVESFMTSSATREKADLVYEYYNSRGVDLYKLRDYLHSDEMRNILIQIKRKYEK